MPEVLTREERIKRLERQIAERRRKVEATPTVTAPPPAPEPEPEVEPVVMEPVPEEECTHPGMMEQEDGSWLCPVCGFRTPTPAEQLAGFDFAVVRPVKENGMEDFQNALRKLATGILSDVASTVVIPTHLNNADTIRAALELYLEAVDDWPDLVRTMKEKVGFTVRPTNEELEIWAEYYTTLAEGIRIAVGMRES